MSRIHHYYTSASIHFAENQIMKDFFIKESADFLTKTHEFSMKLFLTKSELIEKISYLSLYMKDNSAKELLRDLTLQIHNYQFSDDPETSKSYIEAKTFESLQEKYKADKTNMNSPSGDTPIQKLCKEIQSIVNPTFYKDKLY